MSDIMSEIAERIREIRESCEMTREEAAERLHIPLEKYTSYEDAKSDIPISVLYEMARLFKVDLTDLLTGKPPRLQSYCLVRNGEGIEIERYKGYSFQSLAFNFKNKKVEPLLVTIEPEENKKMSLVTHPGQEFNYVLEGKLKIILGGTEIEMSKGDSIYFDPTIPHGQMAVNGEKAKFLTIILHDDNTKE
ncbi:MAG TPA: helix-turn-helix transcriptional regulator [Clostridiaceae bacterium]|nr:helix-turn-helix transcriptional regulator [Clostridiaceae bacterium]